MKKLTLILLALMLAGCGTTKYRMKNCSKVGEVGGDSLYDCEEYKTPSHVRER